MLYNRAKFLQCSSKDDKKKNNNIFLKNQDINKNENQLSQQQLKILKLREQIVKDISHPRIRQLINSHKSPQQLINRRHLHQKKQQFHNNLTNLQLLQQRKWLSKKGKKYLIDFDDNQRKQMKFCFNAMDIKQQGSVGIDELQQLLISVGLMQSRQQVKQLIDSVDQDKSGKIQFAQFLKMILNDQGENQEIVQFFKTIINQNIQKSTRNTQNNQETINQLQNNNKVDALKKKISLITEKQNMYTPLINEKLPTKQSRMTVNKSYEISKCFSDMQKNKNSALKIFQKHPHPKNLPFGMVVSHIRRKHMMTALRIGSPQNISSNIQNKSDNMMRSSQNMKQICKLNTACDQQDVNKGQNVMNALKKMWDRRLLRQIRQNKKIQKIQQLKKANFQFPI